MQTCRTVGRKGALLFGLVGLLGCTASPPNEKMTNSQPDIEATETAQRPAPAPPARSETTSGLPPAEPTSPPGGAPAGATQGPCESLSAADARGATGLRLVGSAGTYRFFAEQRALLCSEPGTGGIGECEIVRPTIIRVESGARIYGLKSRAGVPAILVYGPQGISCVAPR
jgi:hypothetical protein